MLHNKKEHLQIDLIVDFPLMFDIETIFKNSPYFKTLNDKDKLARNIEPTKHVIKHYLSRIVTLTQEEKDTIRHFIKETILNLSPSNQKLFLLTNWNIIVFDNLENNYPHTHGNSIMIPKNSIINMNNNS